MKLDLLFGRPRTKLVAVLACATAALVTAIPYASAQTLTTRAPRTVNTHHTIWYKPIDAQGRELSGNWQQYGYVKFDVEVREPTQGYLAYTITRRQPVATAANTQVVLTTSNCVGENGNTRIRCFYTVRTTVSFATTGIKQTNTWKAGGGGSVEATTPLGTTFKGNAEGEGTGATEQNIVPSLSFERSFEFVVQLRNSCTTNPGYSVYLQGSATPLIVHSTCNAPVAQGTKYCGRGRTPNKLANGQVDGEWVWMSDSPVNSTLRNRLYRLERNNVATSITQTNACPIGGSSCHVFQHYNWWDGALRKNITVKDVGYGQNAIAADQYAWDWEDRDYTILIKAQGDLGGCPTDQLVRQPSYGY